jgi:kynurenine formamidase
LESTCGARIGAVMAAGNRLTKRQSCLYENKPIDMVRKWVYTIPDTRKGAQADETYSRCPAQAARANALLPDKFPADRLRKNRKMPLSGRSARTYIVTIKGEPTMADYKLWNALKDAEKYRWVELSHSLNNESPYWSGIPEGSVELAKTVWDWGKPELECLIQTFKFPGQFGTHIDFPGHFIKGKALSEKYDVNDLIFPLVVIDISEQAKKDPRYAVTVEDIKAYEAKYGPIPDGALVALRSDWHKKWPDMDALSGIDAEGKENAPGWSLEALEYIYKVRNAAANGHETLDTDSSAVAEEKGDLACERYVLDNDKLQVEVLANLDKVQPAGAVVIVSYPRIEGATGLPARVWAITE